MLRLCFWWPAPPSWSGHALLDWPRWWEALLWPFRRYSYHSTLQQLIVLGSYWYYLALNIFASVSAVGFICPFVPLLPVMCILINTYLLINLGWVLDPFSFFTTLFKTDIFFNMHELVGYVLQWRHMDASGGVAGDGGVRLHFLWPHPQLIDRCRVCPCGWGEWDIWAILFIRVCGVKRDGRRCLLKPILS